MSAYERLGAGYAGVRRPDPRIGARIRSALGANGPIINVGTGAGSYEPSDLPVVAVEPAFVMLAQRPAGAAPAVRAVAEAIPFADHTFAAGVAVLTVHHWRDLSTG